MAQNWTQDSRCHLRGAEKRGMIIPLDVLAMLLSIQPRMPLALLAAQAHSRDAPPPDRLQPVSLRGVNKAHHSLGDSASESGILSSALNSADSSKHAAQWLKKMMLISS